MRKHVTAEATALLAAASSELAQLTEWSAPRLHETLGAIATAGGVALGKLAQPIRLAMCGGTVSPPIDATLAILGKTESLARLAQALRVWGA